MVSLGRDVEIRHALVAAATPDLEARMTREEVVAETEARVVARIKAKLKYCACFIALAAALASPWVAELLGVDPPYGIAPAN
ncbi:hypothetical protein DM860_008751 [Cuscuta australis]|uniref:Uncharacterized protein n=1 Tax=Cuscuta australis TaxID=267555 RepID=A0A328DAT2_9ASTE|nr:hypothetical protein DM860_008751 [Cuscuta australis]